MRLSPILASGALSIPLAAADRLLWQTRLGSMAILRLLGVELSLEDEHVVRLTLKQHTSAHVGGLGTEALNGAIIAGMMDCAMSVAGILHFRGRTCGTVQLSIQFMKPVRATHPVVVCHAVRKSPSVVFLEARLLGEDGRCSALATGVVGVARLSKQKSGEDGRSNWLAPLGREESIEVV
jgi:acyl-coenzyme A thioesterase PaaI-like protein